jgi:hypothetical protein
LSRIAKAAIINLPRTNIPNPLPRGCGTSQVESVTLDLMPRSSQIAFVIPNKLRVVGFSSGGTIENSPAFQRRELTRIVISPAGTTEKNVSFQTSLRDAIFFQSFPALKRRAIFKKSRWDEAPLL